jgi:transcription elongation factor Elf1
MPPRPHVDTPPPHPSPCPPVRARCPLCGALNSVVAPAGAAFVARCGQCGGTFEAGAADAPGAACVVEAADAQNVATKRRRTGGG